MRILQVVHGYPPRYNAGSEVYTQTLCRTLAWQHDVMVFSRFEDAFLPPYSELSENDVGAGGKKIIPIRMVNLANFRDRYQHVAVDAAFQRCLDEFTPDVIHVQHLNHLSTSMVVVAARAGIPVIFTLHDFWLMCPRGQFIQFFDRRNHDVLPLCDAQEDRKCAERCYSRYFSGSPADQSEEIKFYADWVGRRMAHIREICNLVNIFVAPSLHLRQRFIDEFGLHPQRVKYLDYGFELNRLQNRHRAHHAKDDFVFGYVGTHVAAKGIHHLLEAFTQMSTKAKLRIWGRPNSDSTPALKAYCEGLPSAIRDRISWEGEYRNEEIVSHVFNHVDAIVVPSIWQENSPLVIHEAQQARVPVITANTGGMAEFVQNEVNGLLFRHRDPASLAIQMARFVRDPGLARNLGNRGYLYGEAGNVPSAEQHAAVMENYYKACVNDRSRSLTLEASK